MANASVCIRSWNTVKFLKFKHCNPGSFRIGDINFKNEVILKNLSDSKTFVSLLSNILKEIFQGNSTDISISVSGEELDLIKIIFKSEDYEIVETEEDCWKRMQEGLKESGCEHRMFYNKTIIRRSDHV